MRDLLLLFVPQLHSFLVWQGNCKLILHLTTGAPIHLQFLILKTYSCFLLKLSSWSQSRLPKTIDHCKTQVCCNNQAKLQSHLALYCSTGSQLFLIPFVKYETTPSGTDVAPNAISELDWMGGWEISRRGY